MDERRHCVLWKKSICGVRWKDTDVRKITEPLGVVHAIADDKMIRDAEAHVLCLDRFETPIGLVEKRGHAQRARTVLHEHAFKKREREPGVEYVFDQDDVASLDRMIEILDELDGSAGTRALAVTGDSNEIKRTLNTDGASEIGEKDSSAFEYAYQQYRLASEIPIDLRAEFDNAGGNRIATDQNGWMGG
jgi:hypothetical protein